MSRPSDVHVPILELRPLDGRVIVEVYKLLTKLLGPNLSAYTASAGAGVPPADCPFSLTISVSQTLNPTLALLETVTAASSSDKDALAMDQEEDLIPPKRRRTGECHSLHDAAESNDVAKVKELLAKNHNPYKKDADGRLPIELSTSKAVWRAFGMRMHTPPKDTFFQVVSAGDAVAVRLLLAAGVNPATMSSEGRVAVHEAIVKDRVDVLRALLDSTDNLEELLALKEEYRKRIPGTQSNRHA
ncbi:hypothetical protein HDU96_010344 [Phlyctochytrium bullatum]|nr:hypothetical protein HDU96_010344 [Phlyctochytrium bullatum]